MRVRPAHAMSDELERHQRAHHARRARLRRFLRALPRRANVRRYPIVRWFAEAAHKRPYLWSFKRASVVPALYVGSVIGCTPYPGQVLFAVLAMLALRGNLAIAVALQFISNPFSFVALYGATYFVGYSTIEWFRPGTREFQPTAALEKIAHGELAGAWDVVGALLVGGLIVGLLVGFALDLVWRFAIWEAGVFKAKMQRLHSAAERRRIEATNPHQHAPDTD
jgi:uncharacterized protein (DUF2062 family)